MYRVSPPKIMGTGIGYQLRMAAEKYRGPPRHRQSILLIVCSALSKQNLSMDYVPGKKKALQFIKHEL